MFYYYITTLTLSIDCNYLPPSALPCHCERSVAIPAGCVRLLRHCVPRNDREMSLPPFFYCHCQPSLNCHCDPCEGRWWQSREWDCFGTGVPRNDRKGIVSRSDKIIKGKGAEKPPFSPSPYSSPFKGEVRWEGLLYPSCSENKHQNHQPHHSTDANNNPQP